MKTLVLDFETFFSDDFTLKKLTTEAYIRDPQFEALCLGVYDPVTKQKSWVPQEAIPEFINRTDWSQTAVLCHHAHFDGLIFAHHFGMRPAFWFDTLCMARAIHGNHISVSLANLLKIYGVPEKTVPYDAFKGRRWINMPDPLRMALGNGAADDCEKTYQIFEKLIVGFPKEELRVIDLTIRMFTEPKLVGDVAELQRIQAEEWSRKDELIQQLGISKADLNSADKFAAILESMGVEVDYKETLKGNMVPAIAKTDRFMKELENDQDPTISALATARMEVRSTIDQTRAGRLAGMAERGRLPVYLQYYGAHTGRWSGGDKVNLQNLPREGAIREAIHAPEGYLIFEPDFSQIECRVEMWLAGQEDQLEAFRQGRDTYCEQAEAIYLRPITKKDNPNERHLGKVLKLGAGYGMGFVRLQQTCAQGALGGPPIHLTTAEAEQAIAAYRRKHYRVVAMWKEADWFLGQIVANKELSWGPMTLRNKRIYLPNGLLINYETLEWHQGEFRMLKRNGWTKMYGAKLVENVVQGLARVVASQAMLRLAALGYPAINTTHDSLMVLLPDDEAAQDTADMLLYEMARPPVWMPDIPLAAEGKPSRSYAK